MATLHVESIPPKASGREARARRSSLMLVAAWAVLSVVFGAMGLVQTHRSDLPVVCTTFAGSLHDGTYEANVLGIATFLAWVAGALLMFAACVLAAWNMVGRTRVTLSVVCLAALATQIWSQAWGDRAVPDSGEFHPATWYSGFITLMVVAVVALALARLILVRDAQPNPRFQLDGTR